MEKDDFLKGLFESLQEELQEELKEIKKLKWNVILHDGRENYVAENLSIEEARKLVNTAVFNNQDFTSCTIFRK